MDESNTSVLLADLLIALYENMTDCNLIAPI